MKFWKSVKRFFAGKGALHYAAQENDINAVKSLLASGFAINEIFNTGSFAYTALGFSLLRHAYESAIVLLEQNADPNIHQPSSFLSKDVGKVIQPYLYFHFSANNTQDFNTSIKQRNACIIRLLTWYGTTEENLTFREDSDSQAFKILFLKIRERYKEKIQLEEKLKALQNTLKEEPNNEKLKEAQAVCLQLSVLWEEMYQEEKKVESFNNNAFRVHYQNRTDFYKKLAKKYDEELSLEVSNDDLHSDSTGLLATSMFRHRGRTTVASAERESLLPIRCGSEVKKIV